MKRTALVLALVAVFVFAFAGTAFAAYSQAFTVPATMAPGYELVIDPVFTKGDADPASSYHYVEVLVTGPNAPVAVVPANPLSFFPDDGTPAASGTDWAHYTSMEYAVYTGNEAILPPGASGLPTLRFEQEGIYTVEVMLVDDTTGVYPNPVASRLQSTTYSVLVTASTAEPTVIDPADGGSMWSYQDAYDAAAKREGGYRLFDNGLLYASDGAAYDTAGGWVDQSLYASKGPHGGYDTTTNKCKTCHAVHRAEGTYYLLRATSSDDACDYCHIGGGAHSAKVVYTANEGGKYTNNGHTMGSGPTIPDSSIAMAIEHVTIDRVGEEDIHVPVRVYEAERKELFRVVGFGRHPAGHPSFGYNATPNATTPVFAAVGPTSLSCSNCHQTHNATSLIWQPRTRGTSGYSGSNPESSRLIGGYKLLRAFPGASVADGELIRELKEEGEMLGSTMLAKVPESTLLPYAYKGLTEADKATNPALAASFPAAGSMGVALFKDEVAHETGAGPADTQYTDWDGITWQSPDWAVNSHGWHDYDFDVQQATLAYWCADCHNLNIGGRGVEEGTAELGFFKAHAERTHPVPASRGFQCYSCHRGSLDYNLTYGASSDMTGTSCTNCHFASNEYLVAQAVAGTDWPHSSGADDYKLLGNFSLANAPSPTGFFAASTSAETTGTFRYSKTTVTKDNLDAVCLRCHTDIGVMN